MATYKELISRINNAFETGKKLKITAHDIESLNIDENNKLQQTITKQNIKYISK